MRGPAGRRGIRRGREEGRRPPARGVRSFVAVLLPDALRGRMDEAVAPLRAGGAAVSWVRADNFHVTLRFLGALDEPTLARVREALAEAAAETPPFQLTFGGLGGFPSPRSPRVLWVGIVAGADALAGLHGRLERALARRGFPAEGRAFHGHVTVGRARDPRGTIDVTEALDATTVPLGDVAVDAVYLMRSDLHPAGARYSVLAREPLGGAPEGARV